MAGRRVLIYADDALLTLEKNHMPELESNDDFELDIEEDDFLSAPRALALTRNEALYLSDSVTLLMEHIPEQGKIHVPARQLMPQAGVPVPLDLIQKIGLAVLVTTSSLEEEEIVFDLEVTVADLFLLRECCQSFIKINNELVGFNLLRKIYELVLDEDINERRFLQRLTKGLDLNLISETEEGKEQNG